MTDDDRGVLVAIDARWTALRAALVRAVRRQCPAWLSAHAEDLVQAALMKVMAVTRANEGKRTLSSLYLNRVAHSALVDEIRRHQRRREVALEVNDPEDEGGRNIEPQAAGDPEQDAALRELGVAVQSCLQGMLDDRRLAVMLHLQGHQVPEAARVLGWSVKRTENLVYRGLGDLRQCLIAKGHSP